MKRVLSLLLCVGLCLGLAGCGGSDKKTPAKKEYVSEKDLKKVYSDPEKYVGKYVKLTGKVFTSPEKDDDAVYFQMWADVKNNDMNTIVAYGKSDFEVNEDDYVIVDGEIVDKFEGENSFGGTVSAVQIVAKSVKISSYIDVVSPTIKEVKTSGLANNQNNVNITIDKVEFAKSETRVYYTVANNSGSKYSFYDFNMKVVQNGKQFELDSDYEADYPEVSGEILNGISASGIASFKNLEQANFDVHFEAGYSDNYDLDFSDFVLSVIVE